MAIKTEDFLASHQLLRNPFTEDDSQNDQVFIDLLAESGFRFNHADWEKFCGYPMGIGTSMVFGSKGSGKSAMRLAMERIFENDPQTSDKILLVKYDNFNEFLEKIKQKIEKKRNKIQNSKWFGKKPVKQFFIDEFKLVNHLDSMLVCSIQSIFEKFSKHPQLLENIISGSIHFPENLKKDLYFLATVYLKGSPDYYTKTLKSLAGKFLVNAPLEKIKLWAKDGINFLISSSVASILFAALTEFPMESPWTVLIFFATFASHLSIFRLIKKTYFKKIAESLNSGILVRERETNDLSNSLANLDAEYLDSLTLKNMDIKVNEELRFQLLKKLLQISSAMGFERVVVIMDRIDEPHMIMGDKEKMYEFIKPLWNNKLLQMDENISFKMLLPKQLHEYVRKADSTDANIARWDKQKIIYPFRWSKGELYDLLSDRLRVCRENKSESYPLLSLFESDISKDKVLDVLDKLRQPRFALKFMYNIIRQGCAEQDKTDEEPVKIGLEVFYKVKATIERDIIEYYENVGESPD